MSNFPLYNNLVESTTTKDLTVSSKREMIKTIKNLDNQGFELLYVLIKVYYINNSLDSSNFTLPYNGKFVDQNVHFDLEKLPNRLKQILKKFTTIHVNIPVSHTI